MDPKETYSYHKKSMLYSIIDTGSSAMIIASDYFEKLIEKIYESAGITTYEFYKGMPIGPCVDEFPSLYFMFDFQWVEIIGDDYARDISE